MSVMDDYQILISGDYTHRDFEDLVGYGQRTTTLMRLDFVIEKPERLGDFDLIVLAQSRPGQFATDTIEQIVEMSLCTPVVLLCGSWCEGELRSGCPVSGTVRVYWHQWQGRSEYFFNRVSRNQNLSWNLPRIATDVDQILHESDNQKFEFNGSVGISSQLQENFEMLRDCMGDWGGTWIESLDSNQLAKTSFSVICLEANSLTTLVEKRIQELRNTFPEASIVLCLNFPRHQELQTAKGLGISAIVSKPFRLSDLRITIQNAIQKHAA